MNLRSAISLFPARIIYARFLALHAPVQDHAGYVNSSRLRKSSMNSVIEQ